MKKKYPVVARPGMFACIECGCIDVQGTCWIELNINETTDEYNDDIWCPACEEHYERVRIAGDHDSGDEPATFTLEEPKPEPKKIKISVPRKVREALANRGNAVKLYVACRAAEARIQGEFDLPELVAQGPLSTKTTTDVLAIIHGAIDGMEK